MMGAIFLEIIGPEKPGRSGCSPDNAACEGFFGRLKMELFYPRNVQNREIGKFRYISHRENGARLSTVWP